MKRSEVVTKIQSLLESVGYVGNNSDGDKVLKLLESLGMQPPGIGTPRIEYTHQRAWSSEDE